ncbi:uncharacterized protein LOC112683706 [Sipha flava]|uniref:Uncharacterized protein LOC112683706 n=1 Tax=Sipha flava TaxID=143950 RepID=A0A8B8FIX9_9HEMI|nr:uncharacterized protein LOC112683706 [Sipha flava]
MAELVSSSATTVVPGISRVSHLYALKFLNYWKFLVTLFWISVILNLDPDPVMLYRTKTEIDHDLSNRKATVVSTIAKNLKSIIMIIQAFKSLEILELFNDLKAIEKRLNIKDPTINNSLLNTSVQRY